MATDGESPVDLMSRERRPLSYLQILSAMLVACSAAVAGFRFVARADAAELLRQNERYNAEHFITTNDLKPLVAEMKDVKSDIRDIRDMAIKFALDAKKK